MSPQSREDRLVPFLQALKSIEDTIQLGKKDEALDLLEQFRQKAGSSSDGDFQLLFEAVQVRTIHPEHPQQVELLNHAVQWEDQHGFPREPVIFLQIGRFFASTNDHSSAIAWFNEALKVDQRDCDVLRLMGVSILAQGDAETAIKWFEAALTTSEEKDSYSWREKALAEMKIGNGEKARDCMNRAVELRADLWKADQERLEKMIRGEKDESSDLTKERKISPNLISELISDDPNAQAVDDDFPIGGHSKNPEPYAPIHTSETGESALPPVPHFDPEDLGTVDEQPQSGKSETSTLSAESPEKQKSVQLRTFSDRLLGVKKKAALEFEQCCSRPSFLPKGKALWFFLRKNATSCVHGEKSFGLCSGGGHFLWNRGTGTIIDPGPGFLDHLLRIGGSLTEVKNVVITHDNESHLAQCELIRRLLLSGGFAKEVRFFLNLGATQKLSGLVDLHDKAFREGYFTLHPGANYDLSGGGRIKAIPAYHQELKSTDQSVGLRIDLEDSAGREKKIVYTSDTGLFPLTLSFDNTENRIIHISDKNQTDRIISRRYRDEGASEADLMVLHIGSLNIQFEKQNGEFPGESVKIKVNEMDHADLQNRPGEKELLEVCSAGQLGFLGVREVLVQCNPKTAVVCEWSEEIAVEREKISRLLQDQCGEMLPETNPPKVIPGDLSLVYDIFEGSVFDCVKNDWTAVEEIDFAMKKPCCSAAAEEMFYFAEEEKDAFGEISEYYIRKYFNNLKHKQGLYFDSPGE